MTTSPSAPPVLAEEPADFTAMARLAALRFDGDSLHYLNRYQAIAIRNLLTDYDAFLAQARQGREDAERLREDAERWRFFRRFLHVENDDSEDGQFLFFDDMEMQTVYAKGYENTVESLVDLARAATPSPSPEGASE